MKIFRILAVSLDLEYYTRTYRIQVTSRKFDILYIYFIIVIIAANGSQCEIITYF